MCVHDSGVLTEPGGPRNHGSGRGWEGRGAGVGEERRGKVSENGVSMEKGEGLGIRLKAQGEGDHVQNFPLYLALYLVLSCVTESSQVPHDK